MKIQRPLFVLYLNTLYKLWNLEFLLFEMELKNRRLKNENDCLKRLRDYYPGMKDLEEYVYELHRT